MEKRRINNDQFVKQQYKDDKGLLIRKNLHKKYSTNKQGFGNWLFELMNISSAGKILEVGSGNGDFWQSNVKMLKATTKLVLSDFSDGMVELMCEKYDQENIDIMQINIQDIPFEDNSFDLIIANAMLYHVPELEKALGEVKRVLKPSGKFFASTYGENGLSSFIFETLEKLDIEMPKDSNKTFTLQNGEDKLLGHFEEVNRMDYEDKLMITHIQDLVDYIFSMTSMSKLDIEEKSKVQDYLDKLMKEKTIIEIRKEYGCFISSK